MHRAVREIQVGRGWGVFNCPVIDLVAHANGKVWHVATGIDDDTPICPKRGNTVKSITEVDPTTIRIDGLTVCASCRSKLGPVPMPSLAKTPPNERTDQ